MLKKSFLAIIMTALMMVVMLAFSGQAQATVDTSSVYLAQELSLLVVSSAATFGPTVDPVARAGDQQIAQMDLSFDSYMSSKTTSPLTAAPSAPIENYIDAIGHSTARLTNQPKPARILRA